MKSAVRTLLVVLGLLAIGAGVFLLLTPVYPIGDIGNYLMHNFEEKVILSVGAILTLLGLIPLLFGLFPPKKQPGAVLRRGELGEVRITLSALENMVLRVIQKNRWIRDSSRRVIATPQGLEVTVKVKVAADKNLPELTAELQNDIKEYLEEVTGIIVNEVKINVQSVVLDQVPLKVK